MPASPERCQPVPATNGSWSSVRGCRVSCSRSGGRQDVASLQDTRHPKYARGLSIAGLVGHHGGATMERAFGERVACLINRRASAHDGASTHPSEARTVRRKVIGLSTKFLTSTKQP